MYGSFEGFSLKVVPCLSWCPKMTPGRWDLELQLGLDMRMSSIYWFCGTEINEKEAENNNHHLNLKKHHELRDDYSRSHDVVKSSEWRRGFWVLGIPLEPTANKGHESCDLHRIPMAIRTTCWSFEGNGWKYPPWNLMVGKTVMLERPLC